MKLTSSKGVLRIVAIVGVAALGIAATKGDASVRTLGAVDVGLQPATLTPVSEQASAVLSESIGRPPVRPPVRPPSRSPIRP